MKLFWYRLLVKTADSFGSWIFALVARTIAAGYFVFSPRRKESRRLYALVYPDQSRLYHLWCTFRQYQNFTTIHLDRYLASHGRQPTFVSQGLEALETGDDRSGAILLMSHLGNWEMAARLLMQKKRDLRLLLYMGTKEKEGVEKAQKDELRLAGVKIIAADQDSGSPLAMVDGIRLLQDGGFVSMTGDIVWRDGQRCLPVRFLGGIAHIPEAPFVLALVSGAPIAVFFAFRTGRFCYRFVLSEPFFVRAGNRADRKKAIAAAAQRYASLLEGALRDHPLEWYHFDRFVHLTVTAEDAPEDKSGPETRDAVME